MVSNVPLWKLTTAMTKSKRSAILATGAVGALFLCLACAPVFAQEAPAPAKALLEWVADARKAGLTEQQIQDNAAAAGWQGDAVKEALRATGSAAPPNSSAATPAPTVPASPDATGKAPADKGPKVQAQFETPDKNPASPLPDAGGGVHVKPDRGVPDDYIIGEGDVLHVSVWKEPDASVQSVVVRPDGRISVPLVKEVEVLGMTPPQLEARLTEDLKKFLTEPDVTVIVQAINSKKIYLVGAVKKEGTIQYTYRMSVLQALSEAGGLTDYAKKKKIYILRHDKGREFRLPFDYDAVLKGEHMELNVPLLPGDTIVVPH